MSATSAPPSPPPAGEFPVDLVFTWVDGADPAHVEKRRRFERLCAEHEIRPNTRADRQLEARYVDAGEIAFSVESVVRYLPWVRTIFVVTDGQRPPLASRLLASGRVRIVDHRQLVPEEYLPTFNSHVLESCLHRVPGLSEVFLYDNDDYMHFSPVPREAFCQAAADGRVLLRLCVRQTALLRLLHALSAVHPLGEHAGSLHAIGVYNAYAMLRRHGVPAAGVLVPRHSTQVIRRSTAQRLEAEFAPALHANRRLRFRSLGSYSHTTLLYTMEKAWHPGDRVRRALLQDVSEQFRMFDFGGRATASRSDRLWRSVARSNVQFACLNNVPAAERERLREVMAAKGLQPPDPDEGCP